jgi:hypothetical protein
MGTLTEIMNANNSDKGTTIRWAHNYTAAYERWLEPLRNEPIRLLEIGVCDPGRARSVAEGLVRVTFRKPRSSGSTLRTRAVSTTTGSQRSSVTNPSQKT